MEYRARICKYVIVGETIPIIFDSRLTHSDFNFNITSAGFCEIYHENGKIRACCYGESTSLRIESKETDAEVIEQTLNQPEI